MKCFDADFTGDKDAFLQDFADTIVEDFQYLKENGLPVVQFSLQNEPEWRHDTGYSHCHYNADMYYQTVQKVFPTLKKAFPDILIHADSLDGQYSGRSKRLSPIRSFCLMWMPGRITIWEVTPIHRLIRQVA